MEFDSDELVRYVYDDGLDATGDTLLAGCYRRGYLVGYSMAHPEGVNDHSTL